MTWTAAEMPDDALDPTSLVGRLLNPEPVRPELIADAMEFMDDYDGDLQAMADREKAEREATVEPMPLWRVMQEAGEDAWLASCYLEGMAQAAQIEALRDWLLPEEATPLAAVRSDLPFPMVERLDERQRLRAQLTEQARIARGD